MSLAELKIARSSKGRPSSGRNAGWLSGSEWKRKDERIASVTWRAGHQHTEKVFEPTQLRIIYFDQTRQLDTSRNLRPALSPEADSVVYQDRVIHVASWAAKFLFTSEQLDQPVERLSGGERARVLIAQLLNSCCSRLTYCRWMNPRSTSIFLRWKFWKKTCSNFAAPWL